MSFLDKLEEEYKSLDESIENTIEWIVESGDHQFLSEILLESGVDESIVNEALVKRVSSTGDVRKILNKAIRSRRASLTTGLSKAELKLRARKAARTRKRTPGVVRKAIRKRRKAMRKRKQMGIK